MSLLSSLNTHILYYISMILPIHYYSHYILLLSSITLMASIHTLTTHSLYINICNPPNPLYVMSRPPTSYYHFPMNLSLIYPPLPHSISLPPITSTPQNTHSFLTYFIINIYIHTYILKNF